MKEKPSKQRIDEDLRRQLSRKTSNSPKCKCYDMIPSYSEKKAEKWTRCLLLTMTRHTCSTEPDANTFSQNRLFNSFYNFLIFFKSTCDRKSEKLLKTRQLFVISVVHCCVIVLIPFLAVSLLCENPY